MTEVVRRCYVMGIYSYPSYLSGCYFRQSGTTPSVVIWPNKALLVSLPSDSLVCFTAFCCTLCVLHVCCALPHPRMQSMPGPNLQGTPGNSGWITFNGEQTALQVESPDVNAVIASAPLEGGRAMITTPMGGNWDKLIDIKANVWKHSSASFHLNAV